MLLLPRIRSRAALLLLLALPACRDDPEEAVPAGSPDGESMIMADSSTVIVPTGNLLTVAASTAGLSTFTEAVRVSELQGLENDGPYTVFVPSDSAFEQIESETLSELNEPSNRETLHTLLSYHVVPGRYLIEDLRTETGLLTLDGQPLRIGAGTGTPTVGGARITRGDVMAGNGVIHVIDRVLQHPNVPLVREE